MKLAVSPASAGRTRAGPTDEANWVETELLCRIAGTAQAVQWLRGSNEKGSNTAVAVAERAEDTEGAVAPLGAGRKRAGPTL